MGMLERADVGRSESRRGRRRSPGRAPSTRGSGIWAEARVTTRVRKARSFILAGVREGLGSAKGDLRTGLVGAKLTVGFRCKLGEKQQENFVD